MMVTVTVASASSWQVPAECQALVTPCHTQTMLLRPPLHRQEAEAQAGEVTAGTGDLSAGRSSHHGPAAPHPPHMERWHRPDTITTTCPAGPTSP